VRTLSFYSNMLGIETGKELAKMLRRNRQLTCVDLANNRMGPKTFWKVRQQDRIG
jgi:hypothetical protein